MKFLFTLLLGGFITLNTGSAQAQVDYKFNSLLCLSNTKFLDDCKEISVPATLYESSKAAIVMVTHNSDGIDERHHRYAKHLQSNGISALVIDHWKARGIWGAQRNFVEFGKKGANAHNMIIDLNFAALHFQSQGYQKIGYIGESMGGGNAVLLAKREWANHFRRVSGQVARPFDALVGLYGNCNERYSYDNFLPIPTLLMTGELDKNTPAKTCKDYIYEWVNRRGGNFEFIQLAGQHHDFDADFKLFRSPNAQNPANCISTVDLEKITATSTGKTYPNTPAGWNEWRKSCILEAYQTDAMYGNTGDPYTGFKEWTEFLKKTLNR